MIAADTNLPVYAHKQGSPWFQAAPSIVRLLSESAATWALRGCVHEFLAVVTNPLIYTPASTMEQAIRQLEIWLESPSLRLIGESPDHGAHLRSIVTTGKIRGPAVHDARIAVIRLSHGVREFWTADRDFSRFPSLKTVNPLVSA